MIPPDGPEEREAFYSELFAEANAEINREEQDGEVLEPLFSIDDLWQTPVKCIVKGHDFDVEPFQHNYCRRCGDPAWNDLNRELIQISRSML